VPPTRERELTRSSGACLLSELETAVEAGNGDRDAKGNVGPDGGLRRLNVMRHAGGGAGLSILHQGLQFRRRPRRLQLLQLSAMPGERVRPRRLLRGKSIFHCQAGIAVRSQPPIPKEVLMRNLALAILAGAMV